MSQTSFKMIVFTFMALILYNLFRGLYFLVTGKENGRATARALTWRIGLSVALFLVLVALKLSGLVQPHDLNDVTPSQTTKDEAGKESEAKTLEEIEQAPASDGRIRLKP